ncbi:inositol-1-monophosphatase [Haematococcus lacustris]|uniref:Inositol-1-monophosphatase n=1 Tax=Haematococcus lacustris TaxID=44745 RepID=A0A699YX45_HAELA|nr:inositol-1-monophosphatase [Haematococcus lacustris]
MHAAHHQHAFSWPSRRHSIPLRNVRARATGSLEYSELLRVARAAADAGASVVTDALNKPRTVTFKGATDLVTETDKASEEAVLAVLRGAFPDHGLLGEEGGVGGGKESDYLWVVDPIDGTTNFAHSYPAFAVSVGVLHKAKPVAGCVVEFLGGPHAWSTRRFTAHKGGGAFCNDQPIRVSEVATINRSLLVTGFGYEHDAAWSANMELFKELTDVSQGVRRLGAAAVDLCHVALGIVDGYWEYRLKPWDVTAGVVVLQEAGGHCSTMEGQPYSVFDRSMLVSNGHLHAALLDYTRPRTEQLREAGVDLSPWFIPPGFKLHTEQVSLSEATV